MKRQQAVALAALVVMLLSPMAASAQDDAGVRKELEAEYQRLAEAHEKDDLKAIVGLKTADFHAIFPDGRVGDAKVMEQYSRQFLEMNQPPYSIRHTIKKLTVSENKAHRGRRGVPGGDQIPGAGRQASQGRHQRQAAGDLGKDQRRLEAQIGR